MDYLLRFLAILLLAGGVPFFLALGVTLGAVASLGGQAGDPDEQATKFFMLYSTFALSGLLSAAGGLLWAVVNIAYRTKAATPPTSSQQADIAAQPGRTAADG